VNPKRSSLTGSHPLQATPRFRPRVVFSREVSSGAAEAPTEAPRILIVEDDYLVASQMEGALTEAGFEIAGIAGSAEEALELAEAQRPVLVIMDIRLGGKRDGIDAALELFATRGIRCVFATAHHTADVRARAQPANPLAWLPKPYTMPSLIEVAQRALRELQGNKK
jgi:two-component system, response regulator PdtaR